MRRSLLPASAGCISLAIVLIPAALHAQSQALYLKPRFLPPAELAQMLGARGDGPAVVEWRGADGPHSVELRRNDAANLLMFSGRPEDLAAVEAMAKAADVEPRQIAIEARIVEIDKTRALNAGLDWSSIQTSLSGRASWASRHGFAGSKSTDLQAYGTLDWPQMLRLLEENGAATFRDAPSVLTLNNRAATILDGQRVTYVTRYSAYNNLFATDSMDAGLRLNVLPSLGESGYLTLDIQAELTTLSSNISGSPVKDGQIVENTVVVKDGETVLLGGFTRTSDQVTHRAFPVLGHVLPFLFSREIRSRSTTESFVAITPRVVDLSPTLDPATRQKLEGR